MQSSASRSRRTAGVALAALLGLTVLVGCVDQGTPEPSATSTESATPTPTPTPEPDPEINLEGTAGQNRPYFDLVNLRLIDAGGTLNGRAFIDNLVAAGYPREAMELTPDRTSTGAKADSIQFSVQLNGTCLIGQFGNIGYTSAYGKVLGTGRCLVGTTRPIDW